MAWGNYCSSVRFAVPAGGVPAQNVPVEDKIAVLVN